MGGGMDVRCLRSFPPWYRMWMWLGRDCGSMCVCVCGSMCGRVCLVVVIVVFIVIIVIMIPGPLYFGCVDDKR